MRKHKKTIEDLARTVKFLEVQMYEIEQTLYNHLHPKQTPVEKIKTTAAQTPQRSKIITPNRMRLWSEADTLALIDMKAKGLSHRTIGRKLGRSERSINAKWGTLNRGQQ